MNRLFNTIRRFVERPSEESEVRAPLEAPEGQSAARTPALPGFEARVEVLSRYAQQAAEYEDDLVRHFEQVRANLDRAQDRVEQALADGRDRDAFEFVRLASRLRPQYDLLDFELRAFNAVASELILRVNTLMQNIEQAQGFARDGQLNPAATRSLDEAMTRLTRYFVMLERVASARRRELPQRLMEQLTRVIDDRQLDLEMARYVLARRRALGPGRSEE